MIFLASLLASLALLLVLLVLLASLSSVFVGVFVGFVGLLCRWIAVSLGSLRFCWFWLALKSFHCFVGFDDCIVSLASMASLFRWRQ